MKTIFKTLSISAVLISIATVSFAQQGTQDDVSVSTKILNQILLQVDTIQFGTVAAGGGQTYLNPITQSASTNVGFNSRVGRLQIEATPNEPVRVEFDASVKMKTTAGSDSITFVPIISAARTGLAINDANRATSVLLSDQPIGAINTDVTGPNGNGTGPWGLITTDGTDNLATLYIGGYLYLWNTTTAIPSTGPTGTFKGTLNFNVLYAN